MKPIFNEKKATQLAANLIQLGGDRLNYMKLIKLMYLADRAALLRWGRPITYDSYFALPHGPVLSATLDLISAGEEPNSQHIWFDYISLPENYSVSIRQNCALSVLSELENAVVQDIFREYGHMNQWDLVHHLHKVLPEWKDPNGSSFPISYRDILQAAGKELDEIEEIEEEIEDLRLSATVFGFL